MQYLLLLRSDDAAFDRLSPSEQAELLTAYRTYTSELQQAGAWIGSNRLQPAAVGKVIRMGNGAPVVLDSPFTETKEQIAGYYLIETKDEAEALDWARRCPTARHGIVELRPVHVM